MRVMVIVKASKESEAGQLPNKQILTDMGKYNEELVKAGVMLAGEGLKASKQGVRVKFDGSKRTVRDGPFAETKELIGGYAIVEVASKDEAIRLTREFLQLHRDVLGPGYEGESEIREMMGVTSFVPAHA